MHRLLEDSLLSACSNLGKNIIQQSLQQETLPLDGTKDVLYGACQALAEDLLNTVQLKIWKDGCVTQKEILSDACRGLAMLIKTQCPRGGGEIVNMQGDLEYALSEDSLAFKLAEVINTRELVDCVCRRHDDGLRTVLLAACQWLVNDIKALFLFEEVWSNFFADECMVRAELYSQLRSLLSTMVFQIKTGAYVDGNPYYRSKAREDPVVARHQFKGMLNSVSKKQYDTKTRGPEEAILFAKADKQAQYGGNYKSLYAFHHSSSNQFHKETTNTDRYFHHTPYSSIIVTNREELSSYIIELINTRVKQRCYATILKLWRILTSSNVLSCTELFIEKLCYLITFSSYPLNPMLLLPSRDLGGNPFVEDVRLQQVGNTVWPKDTSVVKRWFPDSSVGETEDPGNQCFQIWRIGSKKIERKRPKTITSQVTESDGSSVKSSLDSQVMKPKSTVGCFSFSKKKLNMDDY